MLDWLLLFLLMLLPERRRRALTLSDLRDRLVRRRFPGMRVDAEAVRLQWRRSTGGVRILGVTFRRLTLRPTRRGRAEAWARRHKWSLVASAACVLVGFPFVVPLTAFNWVGGTDLTWETAANWNPGGGPPTGNGDTATINATSDAITTDAVAKTVGELTLSAPFGGSLTLGANFTVDDAGTETGDVTVSAGTLNTAGFTMFVDGDWTVSATFTNGNGTVQFRGGAQQDITTGGQAFFHVVTGVANTIFYLKDDCEVFDFEIETGTTLEIDAVSEAAALELSFTDAAACGFTAGCAGLLLCQGDATFGVTVTTADVAPPPANSWSCPTNISGWQTQADYTTFSYGNSFKAVRNNANAHLVNVTFDNMTGIRALFLQEAYGEMTNITISNSSSTTALFLGGFTGTARLLTNIVITSFTGTNHVDVNFGTVSVAHPEFVNSNFDETKVKLDSSAHINAWISKDHNDVIGDYKTCCQATFSFAKSDITNDFASTDNVQVLDGTLTIDEAAACASLTIDAGAEVVKSGQELDCNGGTLDIGGTLTDSNANFDQAVAIKNANFDLDAAGTFTHDHVWLIGCGGTGAGVTVEGDRTVFEDCTYTLIRVRKGLRENIVQNLVKGL